MGRPVEREARADERVSVIATGLPPMSALSR